METSQLDWHDEAHRNDIHFLGKCKFMFDPAAISFAASLKRAKTFEGLLHKESSYGFRQK
jgi:hypothetical protein